MRRKIALLLTIMMLTSIFPNSLVFAAKEKGRANDVYKLTQLDKGLDYGGGAIIPVPLKSNEVALEWVAQSDGEYRLEYYTELFENNIATTYKVEVDMLKGYAQDSAPGAKPEDTVVDPTAMVIKVRVLDAMTPKPFTYSRHLAPYNDNWQTSSTPLEQYITTFKIADGANGTTASDRSLGLKIGDKLHIKLVYDNTINQMRFSTNEINKGNITPFNLYYGSALVESQSIFKGLEEFEVTPTHLELNSSGKLISKEVIEDNKIVPGSKPGVKVSFEKPKSINKITSTFEYVTDDISAILKLSEEFKGTGNSGNISQLLVNFKLKDAEEIYEGLPLSSANTKNGEVEEETVGGKKYFITYFSKDKTGLNDTVAVWPYLEDGMIIDATLELTGGPFNQVTKPQYTPDNIGHTYVEYTANRIGFDSIAFYIKPYRINGPVTYKLQRSTDPEAADANWYTVDTRYYNDIPDSETITLTTNNQTASYYRVLMETDGGGQNSTYIFKSQVIKYSPDQEPIPLPVTKIIGVDNIYVVPSEDIDQNPNAQPQAIGFDLEWKAPKYDELKPLLQKGNIYYELYLHTSTGKKEPIKVFKASLEKPGTPQEEIQIQPHAGQVGHNTSIEKGKYNSSSDSFTMPQVVLKSVGKTLWDRLIMPKDYLNKGKTDYPSTEDVNNLITESSDLDYLVPGTYYLSMVAVYETSDKTKSLSASQESNLESISLDNVNELIPVPNTIKSEVLDNQDVTERIITFNNVNLQRYIDYMLSPINLNLTNESDRTYEIFFYQDENITPSDLKKISEDPNYKGRKNYDANGIKVDTEYLRDKGNVHLIEYKNNYNGNDDQTDDDDYSSIKLTGLDPNQVYYMQVRVRIEPEKGGIKLPPRHSNFSKVHSFTTGTKPLPPTPDEQTPPAPDNFVVTVPNNTTAKISWESGGDNLQVDKIYYEIVRSHDGQIDEKDLSRKVSITELLNKYPSYKGFSTQQDYVHTYVNGRWQQFGNFWSLDKVFEDNTLVPNNVYYYYIRAIHIVDGQETRSDWVMNPATTSPVDKPIKLKVESTDKYKYDTKDEVVVSFWAPIPKDAKVPSEYDFELAVRGEKDEDFRTDYKVSLIEMDKEATGEHYRHFVYRISDLRPGSRYDIKVRVVDKTKALEQGMEYPKSLYSESINYRTEFDEDEADKENKFEEYLKKYDSEAEKLRRRPYWTTESKKYEGIYKYRPGYIASELTMGNTYTLVNEEGVSSLYYILPSNMLDEASKLGKMVQMELEKNSIYIRPYTLTSEQREIEKAIKALDDGKIDDYYIALEFTIIDDRSLINGQKPLSPEMSINMQVLYTNEEDVIIEDDIMDALNELIDEYREDVIDDLEDIILEDGVIANEKLDSIIAKAIDKVEEKHQTEVARIMKKRVKDDIEIGEIEKPLLVTSQVDSYNVSAYYRLSRSWESMYTFKSMGGYSVEGSKLGTYIFAGKAASESLMPNVPGAQDLVGKYNLVDFFQVDTYGIKKQATKNQVYGAVARVMGAKRGADYTAYLGQRGIQGVTMNGNQVIRQDEAIYIIMQAYEKMYYKPIQSIQITNRQSVQNIGAFQPHHRNYIYAAVQLGVVQPVNHKVLPSQPMTAEEIIKMLSKIVPK